MFKENTCSTQKGRQTCGKCTHQKKADKAYISVFHVTTWKNRVVILRTKNSMKLKFEIKEI